MMGLPLLSLPPVVGRMSGETDTGFGDMGGEGEEAESLAEDGQGLAQ